MKLKEGIYEQVISNKIHEEIKNRENEINIQKEEIEKTPGATNTRCM